jgi:hypothetical protein
MNILAMSFYFISVAAMAGNIVLTPIKTPPTGAFTPASLSGLQAWIDGADVSSMTLSGSTISQANDKSGNSNHLTTQTTGFTYTTNVQNGKSGMATTLSTQMQIPTTDFMTTSGGLTFWLVWKEGTYSSDDVLWQWKNPSGGTGMFYEMVSGFLQMRSDGTFSAQRVSFTPTNGTAYAFFHTYNGAGPTTLANYDFWLNDTNLSLGADSSQALSAGTNATGLAGIPGHNTIGDILEIAIYNRVLTSTERGQLSAYRISKWGF